MDARRPRKVEVQLPAARLAPIVARLEAEDAAEQRARQRAREVAVERCLADPTAPIEPELVRDMQVGLILRRARGDLAPCAWTAAEAFHAARVAEALAPGEHRGAPWERAARGGRAPQWDNINGNDAVPRMVRPAPGGAPGVRVRKPSAAQRARLQSDARLAVLVDAGSGSLCVEHAAGGEPEVLRDHVSACLMDYRVATVWDTWRLFDQFRGHFAPDLATRDNTSLLGVLLATLPDGRARERELAGRLLNARNRWGHQASFSQRDVDGALLPGPAVHVSHAWVHTQR